MNNNIIAIGDLHCPFVHKPAINFLFKIIKAFQPRYIVQVGDSVDFYSASRFPKSTFMTPQEEFIEGRQCLEEILGYIHQISPKSEIHLLMGNHCDRVIKRTRETSPEIEYFVSGGIKEYFKFDNVVTHYDSRTPLEIDDILFMHGYLTGLGKHAIYHQRKVVCGHTHKGGTYFEQAYDGRTIWELNAGYVADPLSKVMSYYPTKYSKSTLGIGAILNGYPQFIPFESKK